MTFKILAHLRTSYGTRALSGAVLVSIAIGGACGSRAPSGRAAKSDSVPIDTVASAGKRVLSRSQLDQIAHGRSIDANRFVNGWIADALVAEGARAGLLEFSRVRQVERSVLTRSLLEEFYDRALADGIPTDAEIAKMTKERWFEVDRPVAAKTTHFVVRVKSGTSRITAQELARKIATSVHNIKEVESFLAVVKAYPSNGLEVVAESLPPVTFDGRGLQLDKDGNPIGEGSHFDESFARAANSIGLEGTQSDLVQTPFGYHVILLERKIAPHQVSIEERRVKFAPDVYARRARILMDRSVEEGKRRLPVRIESSFQEVAAQVQVVQ